VVQIHGRLVGPAVQELERVCRDASGPLVLDVTHLMSADDVGLAALRRLVTDGAQLIGLSPYLALLLEGERPSTAPPRRPEPP
jgi:hypothetical protein